MTDLTRKTTISKNALRKYIQLMTNILLTITLATNGIPMQAVAEVTSSNNETTTETPVVSPDEVTSPSNETPTDVSNNNMNSSGEQIVIENDANTSSNNDENTTPNEPTVIHIHFETNDDNLKNGTKAQGTIDIFDLILDNEPHKLPKNTLTCEGYEFIGWSTTKDNKDIADNPDTPDTNEAFAAYSVADETEFTNLGYNEYVTEPDPDNPDQLITKAYPRNLEYAVQNNTLTLWAQWKEIPEEPEVVESFDETPTEPQLTQDNQQNAPPTTKNENPSSTKDEQSTTTEEPTNNTKKTEETTDKTEIKEEKPVKDDKKLSSDISDTKDNPQIKEEEPQNQEPAQTRGLQKVQADDEFPRQADGSNIENISITWLTNDDVEDENPNHLSLKPNNDGNLSVRMRINYALSGEHNYEPGDIRISIPKTLFLTRDGQNAAQIDLPYPQEANNSKDFMWSLVSEKYVFTNSKQMSAATKGYLDIGFDFITPHTVVDSNPSENFDARIEVTTHLGNTIALTSDTIWATIDTESKVTLATNYTYNSSIQCIPFEQVPVNLRTPGETDYVVVTWYSYPYVTGNTPYTLTEHHEKTDDYQGQFMPSSLSSSQDVTLVNNKFVANNEIPSKTFKYIYPLSQFSPGTVYTFKSNAIYTLTETDPEIGDDPQLITQTEQEGSITWSWTEPQFVDPTGHFMLNEIGNDGTNGHDDEPFWSHPYKTYKYKRSDITIHNQDDWYGIYPSAINELAAGNDTNISWTVETIGYMLPWTLDGDPKILSNYGQKPVTMTTYIGDDTESSAITSPQFGDLILHHNYEYVSIQFPKRPTLYKATSVNMNADGTFTYMYAGDGTIKYEQYSDITQEPDVTLTLEAQINGNWQKICDATWHENNLSFTNLTTLAQDDIVMLPAGTEKLRLTHTSGIAALYYYVRPSVKLKADNLQAAATSLLNESNTPRADIQLNTRMFAYSVDEEDPLVDIPKNATDSIRGYSTDIAVIPHKASTYSRSDVDYDNQRITIHYSAQVNERTFIPDLVSYTQAINDGAVIPETQGVFYDLLPPGMTPDTSTIRLRNGDSVLSIATYPNWRDSGRTLMVVKTRLTPNPSTYYDLEGTRRYEDTPEIKFDAYYSFQSFHSYGDHLHNVIAFESLARPAIGSVNHYCGETDDPRTQGNITSLDAFESTNEMDLMTNLDPTNPGPRFVYAGDTRTVNILSAARTSLSKDIDVNNEGKWSKGTYDDVRTAEEGGPYSYRLSMVSDAYTTSKDLIVYDSLENYEAVQGNDPNDINAPRWRGTLINVDTSAAKEAGADPKVYYSTVDNLQLSDETNPNVGNAINLDLTNSNIWIPKENYTGPQENIHAIAVDLSKKPNGEEFTLPEGATVAVTLNMRAPWGATASEAIANDAHAYNNVYLTCTSIDNQTLAEDSDNFVRNDYTKVGLTESKIHVTKEWDDDDNRDGIRPNSLHITLYANDQSMCEFDLDNTTSEEILHLDNGVEAKRIDAWAVELTHVPKTDQNGQPIAYTLEETPVTSYTPHVTHTDNNTNITITNKHEPEKIHLSGTKTWDGPKEKIPSYITINLYAGNTYIKSVTVKPNSFGEWNYDLGEYYKYENQGQEINYHITETTPNPSWIATIDQFNVNNEYHPFGDLTITKTAPGQTNTFKNQPFTLTIILKDKNNDVLEDSFNWSISDNNAEPNSAPKHTGTITSGNTIDICSDETLTIHELPENTKYTVKENEYPGYTTTYPQGREDTITPNRENIVEIINTYTAETNVNFSINKEVTGHVLKRYQFTFDVLDENDIPIRTAFNNASGEITFGAITYTQANAGHTYDYPIVERNDEKPGYTYDDTVYTARVTITDNGNGTLTPTLVYLDENNQEVDEPTFSNIYHATGETTVRTYKRIPGSKVQANEFSFELINQQGTVVSTAPCDADGIINLGPLQFDETDVNNTYLYTIREINNNQNTDVNYDDSLFGIAITVHDNDDGTLSFDQQYMQVQENTEEGNPYIFLGESEQDPIFTNKLKPATITVTKQIDGEVPADHANDTFQFRLTLTGEAVKDSEPMTLSVNSTNSVVLPANVSQDTNFDAFNWLTSLFTPTPALADELVGNAYAITTTNNELVFFRSTNTYDTADNPQTVTDIEGNTYTGDVHTHIESNDAYRSWDLTNVTKAYVSGNQIIKPTKCQSWFASTTTLSNIDLSQIDFSECTNMQSIFAANTAITNIDFSNKNLSQLTNFDSAFNGCTALQTATFTNTDLSSVKNINYTFKGCTSLTNTNLIQPNNMPNLSTAEHTFEDCTSLPSNIDLSHWNVPHLKSIDNMFSNCTSIESVDFSYSDFTSLVSIEQVFTGVPNITLVDFSNVTFNRVDSFRPFAPNSTNGYTLKFDNCDFSQFGSSLFLNETKLKHVSLKGVVVNPNFTESEANTTPVSYPNYMFQGCTNLETVDMSNVTMKQMSLNGMFQGCTNLKSIDLSNSTFYYINDISNVFSGCASLEELIWPNLYANNTSGNYSFSGTFAGCTSLKYLRIPNWTIRNGSGLSSGSLSGCSALEYLDISNYKAPDTTYQSSTFAGIGSPTKDFIIDAHNAVFSSAEHADIRSMFQGCYATEINLENAVFGLPTAGYFYRMFQGCTRLKTLNMNNVTMSAGDMTETFAGCTNLEGTIPFETMTMGPVTYMTNMFQGCAKLGPSLDISNFNTANLHGSRYAFAGCSSLKYLDMHGLYMHHSLESEFNNLFAGSYLEEIDMHDFTMDATASFYGEAFFACIGSTLKKVNLENVTFRGFAQFKNFFAGCSKIEELDLSSPTLGIYNPNQSYMYLQNMLSGMTSLKKVKLGSSFSFDNNHTMQESYQAQLPDPPTTDGYSGLWINSSDPDAMAVTAEQLRLNYNPNVDGGDFGRGTYVWDRGHYQIQFISNNGYGSMSSIGVLKTADAQIPKSLFKRPGYRQTGWFDAADPTKTYALRDTIPANTYLDESIVRLVAIWTPESDLDVPTETLDFTLQADQTATITNVPAGASYIVSELQADGWHVIQQTNNTGNTKPQETHAVTFINKYDMTYADISLTAKKTIEETIPTANQFTFELLENGVTIQTATNDSSGAITFTPLQFDETDIGTHFYQIREIPGNDATIKYDTHIENVTVTIARNESGVITATPTYDQNGANFRNNYADGELVIYKSISGPSSQANNTDFEVEVEFTGDHVDQLAGITAAATVPSTPINIITSLFTPKEAYADDYTLTFDATDGIFPSTNTTTNDISSITTSTTIDTKYAHTPNISDAGVQNGNYANNLNSNKVVTIPGASSLTVQITYATESTSWDWACVWAGNYPNYTAANNYGSSISGKLGGTTKTTKTYEIQGNTVTFGFRSDSSVNNYGYYAIITGKKSTTNTTGTYQQPIPNDSTKHFTGWINDQSQPVDWSTINTTQTIYATYSDESHTITFDANGGSNNMSPMSYTYGVTIPTCTFTPPESNDPAYIYINKNVWNTEPDGSGTTYQPGTKLIEPINMTLYAQWQKSYKYTVNHCQEDIYGNYQIKETETLYASTSTVTPSTKSYAHFISPSTQTVTIATDGSTVVTYKYSRERFTVTFSYLPYSSKNFTQQVAYDVPTPLPNATIGQNLSLVGWAPYQNSPNYTPAGEKIAFTSPTTLYAICNSATTYDHLEGNTYTMRFKIKGGTNIHIPNIPHGTTYKIKEINIPEGYTLTNIQNATGVIEPNDQDIATINNEYHNKFQGSVVMYKSLDGRLPKEGEFTFQLMSRTSSTSGDAEIIGYATNQAPDLRETIIDEETGEQIPNPHYKQAKIEFTDLNINDVSSYGKYFYITEIPGNDQSITYDQNTLSLYANLYDDGKGHLISTDELSPANYSYSSDVFYNRTKQNNLTIRKNTENETNIAKHTIFPFDITLNDAEGNPVDGKTYTLITSAQTTNNNITPEGPTESSMFQPSDDDAVITFDANGGYFSDNTATNKVAFTKQTTSQTITKHSYTKNVNEDGTQQTDLQGNRIPYQIGWNNSAIRGTDRHTPSNDAHVITIPGATSLSVNIRYDIGYYYPFIISAWKGQHPEYQVPTDINETDRFFTSKSSSNSYGNTTSTVTGDSVTISAVALKEPSYSSYYGYYATITGTVTKPTATYTKGTYETPQPLSNNLTFAGWYSDAECTDGNEVDPDNLEATPGSKTTLYAKWEQTSPIQSEQEITFTNGHATIELQGNQEATIYGIGQNSTYSVSEIEQPGWTLMNATNQSGTLTEDTTTTFLNTYQTSGELQLEGYKETTGTIDLNNETFTFIVTNENDELITIGTSTSDGSIVFPTIPLTPDMDGTSTTWHISEDITDDGSGIIWDEHIEDVTISINDDGQGHMTANITYDNDGIKFHNSRPINMPKTGLNGTNIFVIIPSLIIISLAILEIIRRLKHNMKEQK